MRLVDDWQKAWRWSSVRLIGVAATFQLTVVAFPDKVAQYVPDYIMHWLAVAALAGAVLGRLTTTEPHNDNPH